MVVENSFNRALRNAVSCEFADIPKKENEIQHSFSSGFLHQMDKLIKAEQSRFWKMTCTAPRWVVVILVFLLLITLTACSIPSVRAAVVNFIRETYDNYIILFTEEAEGNKISEEYGFAELPDGLTEINGTKTDARIVTNYQNAEGDRIILSQSIAEDYAIYFDNENGEIYEINLPDMNVTIYESDDCIVAVWLQDEYAFNLTVYRDHGIDFMIKLIRAVQRQ